MTRSFGDNYPPKSIRVLARDEYGRVSRYQVGNRSPWDVNRDEAGVLVSVTDGLFVRYVLRDENGRIYWSPVEPVSE